MGNYLLDEESEDLILAVIKNDCPTCQLLIPTLDDLGKTGKLTVVLQDEIDFPSSSSNSGEILHVNQEEIHL